MALNTQQNIQHTTLSKQHMALNTQQNIQHTTLSKQHMVLNTQHSVKNTHHTLRWGKRGVYT